MLARAELPNLAKIRAGGNYTRLKTTYPAQTPVAWSSFATGTNPGGHGIFDFISRDPEFWDKTHDPCYRPEKYKTISPSRQLLRNPPSCGQSRAQTGDPDRRCANAVGNSGARLERVDAPQIQGLDAAISQRNRAVLCSSA